jgi:DedD protein
MEHSMRDLDRLQEQDPDERGRQVGIWLVLAILLFAVFGAVFVAWSRANRAKHAEADPLDQLGALHTPRARDAAGGDVKPGIDPTKLTFQTRLGNEERPEVLAALAAADREEEELAAGDSDDAVKPVRPAALNGQIPAGLTASSAGSKLEKSAAHDKLVAAALPKAHNTHQRQTSGANGDFILHVISYEAKDEAESFANALRVRGHQAYVEAGHVDGRGRTFRVRIGPFKTKQAADAYRRDFEERERMNTIVVRHQDDDDD